MVFLVQPLRHVGGRTSDALYVNNERSLPTVFLFCLIMYEVKSELSMTGSGGTGVTRPHGRNTGMDNDIFIVPLLEVTELKSC